MEKLSIFATTLLILLAISNAAIYQTTIFTNEEESEYGQSQQGQRCRQQMQSQLFWQCEQYLRQQQQQQGQDELIFQGIRNQQRQLHRQQQQRQLQGQQLREMMQRAKELPQMCGSGQICRDVGALLWF
ncbi:hypothetical protein PVL29_025613 [Vitis rotundifolia]|uniref:Bifunctional inhibitor/plant lipid transfer protein/seed storage helical domain-containing protein n=1 Tax=Vitis rotundifolia TaxID=103349 RepID=A0AA39D5N5_VITRO|nr:hypothetical protein PVL29_025613 [Vitis rotundifolia]